MKKRMVFHIPWNIDKSYASATSLRPYKMIAAFEEIGYDVFAIMGSGKERNSAFKQLKKMVTEQDVVFDFVYSESSTQPTMIASGKKDLIKYPLLEYRIFNYFKRKNIPIALFYRDIHWKFSRLSRDKRTFFKHYIFLMLYTLDLYVYKRYLTTLFLPSLRMRNYIPSQFNEVFDLPPGAEKRIVHLRKEPHEKLHLFYVGGFGNHYSMHELFKAVAESNDVILTLSIRREDWMRVKDEYTAFDGVESIVIVHKTGSELEPYYRDADVVSLVLRPYEYLNFAMPFKLFEYISFGKPIIAIRGTSFADFIEAHDIGWCVDYTHKSLAELLGKLKQESVEIERKRNNVAIIAPQNYWSERARKVVEKVIQ